MTRQREGTWMNILCKMFGHKFDLVEETIMSIKNVAINRKSFLQNAIICKWCKKEFRLKDYPENE